MLATAISSGLWCVRQLAASRLQSCRQMWGNAGPCEAASSRTTCWRLGLPRSKLSFLYILLKHDLSSNPALQQALPPELCNLTSLQHLDVAHNWIMELPSALERLTSLQTLDVGSNCLVSLNFGVLPSLRKLVASENRILGAYSDTRPLDGRRYGHFVAAAQWRLPQTYFYL